MPLKNLEQPRCTGNRSHPYVKLSNHNNSSYFLEPPKKYSQRFCSNQSKGFWAEDIVIKELTPQGWILAYRRKKLFHGEVDLVFRKQKEILFVEVKFLNDVWNVFERISVSQKQKLISNRIHYSLKHPKFDIKTAIAFVTRDKISKLNLVLLEE